MSKNNLFKSWLKEAQQMLVEALPDAKEVVDGARIDPVAHAAAFVLHTEVLNLMSVLLQFLR